MSKIYVNSTRVQNELLPGFESVISGLTRALSQVNSSKVPNRYSGSSDLLNAIKEIESIKSDVDSLKKYVLEKSKDFSTSENTCVNDTNKIETFTMKPRAIIVHKK